MNDLVPGLAFSLDIQARLRSRKAIQQITGKTIKEILIRSIYPFDFC